MHIQYSHHQLFSDSSLFAGPNPHSNYLSISTSRDPLSTPAAHFLYRQPLHVNPNPCHTQASACFSSGPHSPMGSPPLSPSTNASPVSVVPIFPTPSAPNTRTHTPSRTNTRAPTPSPTNTRTPTPDTHTASTGFATSASSRPGTTIIYHRKAHGGSGHIRLPISCPETIPPDVEYPISSRTPHSPSSSSSSNSPPPRYLPG